MHVVYQVSGLHEISFRDYPDSESIYKTPDSGGECGVPYWTYFPMPTVEKEKPWYSIEQGSVHFTVISTEHDWDENSEQARIIIFIVSYFHDHACILSVCHSSSDRKIAFSLQYKWMNNDMTSVDRSKTPWLIFIG